MADVRELIRRELDARRLSMKEVSERIGKNHAYLQQFLERGKPDRLPEDVREALAPILGVAPGDLKDGKPSLHDIVRVFDPLPGQADQIPVRGMAEGGE